jgi:hypothetical protein
MKHLEKFLTRLFTGLILYSCINVVVPVNFTYGQALITTLTIREKQGQTTTNYPLTFAHVFKQGQVANAVSVRVNGTVLPTQCNVKRRYADGSVRHVVLSVILPTVHAREDLTLELLNGGTPTNTGELTKAQILSTDIQSLIELTNLSGSGYSGSLTANLRQSISSMATLSYWLKGSVVTEILVKQKLNNSLSAAWEVRFYPGWNGIRISNAIENVEANFRGNVAYAVTIQQGNATPTSVYTKATFTHNYSARWRKVFWLGSKPPEVEIRYDFNYLIATGHVMNYDTSLVVPESILASHYSSWLSRPHDIMDAGGINPYFPTSGERSEIGILPDWTVCYLYSMDNRMKEIMLNHAELASGSPVHFRESNPAKSFYGHIVSIDDRPTIWLGGGDSDDTDREDRLPVAIGSTETIWYVDRAHQASFAYIPYLVTGEYYYLEELYYWSGFNLGACSFHPDWGRNYAQGLIRDQVRGEAWASRTLADTATLAPDNTVEKQYFEEKLNNNITAWIGKQNEFPLKNWGTDVPRGDLFTIAIERITLPFHEDFVLATLSHIKELGYNTAPVLKWYSSFIINRFSHPDFNWYNGAPYYFPIKTPTRYLSTWQEASTIFKDQPTSFPVDDYPFSYQYVALGALSTVTEYPVVQKLAAGGTKHATGQQAYDWLRTHVYNSQLLREDPRWAFIPRNDEKISFILWTK